MRYEIEQRWEIWDLISITSVIGDCLMLPGAHHSHLCPPRTILHFSCTKSKSKSTTLVRNLKFTEHFMEMERFYKGEPEEKSSRSVFPLASTPLLKVFQILQKQDFHVTFDMLLSQSWRYLWACASGSFPICQWNLTAWLSMYPWRFCPLRAY